MSLDGERPPARKAGPELLVLARWEEFTEWLLEHTGRWPKVLRFTLTQRIESHALDVVEKLVVARYDRVARKKLLAEVNLTLERVRHLLRLARARNAMPAASFESAARSIDEVGRMLYGWRSAVEGRAVDVGARSESADEVVLGNAHDATRRPAHEALS